MSVMYSGLEAFDKTENSRRKLSLKLHALWRRGILRDLVRNTYVEKGATLAPRLKMAYMIL